MVLKLIWRSPVVFEKEMTASGENAVESPLRKSTTENKDVRLICRSKRINDTRRCVLSIKGNHSPIVNRIGYDAYFHT